MRVVAESSTKNASYVFELGLGNVPGIPYAITFVVGPMFGGATLAFCTSTVDWLPTTFVTE